MSTQKADILNITQAHKLLARILCLYFDAFVQTLQCSYKKRCFLIFRVRESVCVLTQAWCSETFWCPEVCNSLLVNLVQKLSNSGNSCKSYCKKFSGTFLWTTVYFLFFTVILTKTKFK